jgi:hypothetical protein
MWSYAELSQMAKALGGPEMLMKTLTKSGIEIGTKQAKTKYGKFIGFALAIGACIGFLFCWGVNKIKQKKQPFTAAEAASAEQAIIDGIIAYDQGVAKNPDLGPLPEITREEAQAKIDQYVQQIADEMNSEE